MNAFIYLVMITMTMIMIMMVDLYPFINSYFYLSTCLFFLAEIKRIPLFERYFSIRCFLLSPSLSSQKKEKQKIPLPNGFIDPRDEIDHDAIKLAQQFERKYGNAYTGSDCPSTKVQSSTDKGAGYDDNNGFIDDSEAVRRLISHFNVQFLRRLFCLLCIQIYPFILLVQCFSSSV